MKAVQLQNHDGVNKHAQRLGRLELAGWLYIGGGGGAGRKSEPASLENRPRLTPCISTALKPARERPDESQRLLKDTLEYRGQQRGVLDKQENGDQG